MIKHIITNNNNTKKQTNKQTECTLRVWRAISFLTQRFNLSYKVSGYHSPYDRTVFNWRSKYQYQSNYSDQPPPLWKRWDWLCLTLAEKLAYDLKPICKRSNRNGVVTFDNHSKTAIRVVVRGWLYFFNYVFLQHRKAFSFLAHTLWYLVIFCFQILMNATR